MVASLEPRSQFPRRDTSNSTDASPKLNVTLGICVTAVFISLTFILLCIGYFRASWQPERYGPRRATPGQRGQSRAKGLAKAIVESLPVVRFGDDGVKDVELAESTRVEAVHEETSRDGDIGIIKLNALPVIEAGTAVSGALNEGEGVAIKSSDSTKRPNQDNPNCSICLEDFVENEYIRLLPCDHKFHPKCVDPWLENFSGSCPVCRYTFPVQVAENDSSITK